MTPDTILLAISILIYGLGEIGKNTCKNVLEYTSNDNITLVNRTLEKAVNFEQEHNTVSVVDFTNLTEEIHKTDILIVSTGANTPTVTEAHLKAGKELLIIDLSMPENVDVSVKSLKGITLINVLSDDLASRHPRQYMIPTYSLLSQSSRSWLNVLFQFSSLGV